MMPTPTYVPLSTVTLASTDSEIVFSSIPAGYRDLILTMQVKKDSAAATMRVRFNSDSGAGKHIGVNMRGTGSATDSDTETSTWYFINNYSTLSTTEFAVIQLQVLDYAQTDKHKAFLERTSIAGLQVTAGAGRYADTTAINTISLDTSSGTFSIGSTFSLFGVA